MARAVELNREHRLPAPEHELAILDEQRCEPGEKQLPAVRVAVDRLGGGDDWRGQRLQVDAAGPQARPVHLVAHHLGDVDEFGGVRRCEAQPPRDHAVAENACTRSSRTGRLGFPDAAAAETPSIALAKATCTAWGAVSARRREARARQRSPMSRVVAGAAWPPSPWRRIPTSISAAASASLGCISGS